MACRMALALLLIDSLLLILTSFSSRAPSSPCEYFLSWFMARMASRIRSTSSVLSESSASRNDLSLLAIWSFCEEVRSVFKWVSSTILMNLTQFSKVSISLTSCAIEQTCALVRFCPLSVARMGGSYSPRVSNMILRKLSRLKWVLQSWSNIMRQPSRSLETMLTRYSMLYLKEKYQSDSMMNWSNMPCMMVCLGPTTMLAALSRSTSCRKSMPGWGPPLGSVVTMLMRMFLSWLTISRSFCSSSFSRFISFTRICASSSRFFLYFSAVCSCIFCTESVASRVVVGSRYSCCDGKPFSLMNSMLLQAEAPHSRKSISRSMDTIQDHFSSTLEAHRQKAVSPVRILSEAGIISSHLDTQLLQDLMLRISRMSVTSWHFSLVKLMRQLVVRTIHRLRHSFRNLDRLRRLPQRILPRFRSSSILSRLIMMHQGIICHNSLQNRQIPTERPTTDQANQNIPSELIYFAKYIYRSGLLGGVLVEVSDQFLIGREEEANPGEFVLDEGVDVLGGVLGLGGEPELEEVELADQQALEDPGEVDGDREEQVHEVDDLDAGLGLHEQPSVVPDLVHCGLELGRDGAWQLLVIELGEGIEEVEDEGRVEEEVDRANAPHADVQDVLAVRVRECPLQVLLAELWGLQDAQEPAQ